MLVPLLSSAGIAADRHHRDPHRDWRGRGDWHGDIRRFRDHDFDRWRSGRWHHGHHDGRLGWWWIVGGLWYFYPKPIYPYPDPYRPPVVVAPSPSGYWYFCRAPAGYYPYVQYCRVPWQLVVPQPPY